VDQTKKLDGKIAIVTGAGSSGPGFGTGKAISVLLAREGAKIALVDVFEDRAWSATPSPRSGVSTSS
jgi:NAD(P)-dependent dehydrogenase (short-subunit alcohol dehydrogenase family)